MGNSSQHTIGGALRISVAFVSLLFVVLLIEAAYKVPLEQYGIRPRTWPGLRGVVLSPLLHGSLPHLLANAFPLLVLLTLLFWDRHYRPVTTLALIWLVSGLGTWLIGRGGEWHGKLVVHVGASSLIFGLVAYFIVAGILMESWRSAIVGILVLLFFGGLFLGVMPQSGPVSWEGHLSGAVAGVWAARKQHK
ncbi:MAG: rhomboid family intramembrane serine protease [Verrucomicrobia bacterium]|nr:rhomboid family intramembrane serine protease [Verrucomicrobiota bacterium]